MERLVKGGVTFTALAHPPQDGRALKAVKVISRIFQRQFIQQLERFIVVLFPLVDRDQYDARVIAGIFPFVQSLEDIRQTSLTITAHFNQLQSPSDEPG